MNTQSQLRKQLEADMLQFLSNGGVIEHVDIGCYRREQLGPDHIRSINSLGDSGTLTERQQRALDALRSGLETSTQVAHAMGIARQTAHGLIQSLIENRYAIKTAYGRYAPRI